VSAIESFDGIVPKLGRDVFLAPTASVIGKVTLGDRASVWYGAVLRGDVGAITVGARTNIQDLCMVHMTGGVSDCRVGDDVTVGHGAILHGCDVGNRCLVGMASILLDNVRVGDECVIGAGSLLTAGTVIPPRSLVLGRPAKVIREVTAAESVYGIEGAKRYLELVEKYRAGS
jgi:carbonic anhydrase/acetyltransferase-like protein (isoleucine patch superfamily)